MGRAVGTYLPLGADRSALTIPVASSATTGHYALVAERVIGVDLDVTWEPHAPAAVLTARDDGTAVLRLSPHPCDEDDRDVLLVWSGRRLARMEPPNDEARSGHRFYGAGLSDVGWIGEVIESTLIAQLERMNRVHRKHDPSRYTSLRHWIVPLKECTVEVVGQSLIARRGSADSPFMQ